MKTCQTRPPRDNFPSFLSFESAEQAAAAANLNFNFSYVGLGLCLGISPQLIWNISHQQDRYYRSFDIPKKAGGLRTIESPRLFLKVIQWFLADFVLDDLVPHNSVHSFAIKRSIVTNAQKHVSQNFVGNADIEDFFGTITTAMVMHLLVKNQFDIDEAGTIARLCTKDGRLPQGAPTSPVISNSILYEFDGRCRRTAIDRV
jgi:RNA-directed DNA polymerase